MKHRSVDYKRRVLCGKIPTQKPTGEQVVCEARKLIGTPFVNQGRKAGAGCDCIGLPLLVCKSLGVLDSDRIEARYSRRTDGMMKSKIERICQPCLLVEGALLVFKIRATEQHCGIASMNFRGGFNLIHAWDIVGKVCEHPLSQDWINRIVGCYALPGVHYE